MIKYPSLENSKQKILDALASDDPKAALLGPASSSYIASIRKALRAQRKERFSYLRRKPSTTGQNGQQGPLPKPTGGGWTRPPGSGGGNVDKRMPLRPR